MMSVRTDVIKIARDFVRRGGKSNRRKQYSRMLEFASFCESRSPGVALAQVGGRHVIGYYKTLQHLSQSTREAHYYAVAALFRLAGKSPPPRPFKIKSQADPDKRYSSNLDGSNNSSIITIITTQEPLPWK